MDVRKFLTSKRIIWAAVIVIAVLIGWYFIFSRKNGLGNIQTDFIKRQNIQQTVLATGQVVSRTDLDLGFQSSGIVRSVNVKEGDDVRAGRILATLKESSALASLKSAKGAMDQAQANYDKILAGDTPEDIKTVQDSVDSANQDLINAYQGSKNTLNDGYLKIYNSHTLSLYIQNTYFYSSYDQQQIKVVDSVNDIVNRMADAKLNIDSANDNSSTDDAILNITNNLLKTYKDLSVIREQCDQGIYYSKVSSADKASLDTQKNSVNSSVSDMNGLIQKIASLKIALQKANDQLSLKKAPPSQADIDLAKGQIVSAQGQVDAAQADLNNLIIFAPTNGTITQVDIKTGQQATALSEAIILQNITDLHAEANVSEANIAQLSVGQPVDYTFDALGPDKHFAGKILTINPASTVVSGVVNYKITASLPKITDIKPGMTANMTVLAASKDNALTAPYSAIIDKNGKQYLRVVDNPKTRTYHQVEVQTGLQADGGLVEIISGVKEGQEIVSYIP